MTEQRRHEPSHAKCFALGIPPFPALIQAYDLCLRGHHSEVFVGRGKEDFPLQSRKCVCQTAGRKNLLDACTRNYNPSPGVENRKWIPSLFVDHMPVFLWDHMEPSVPSSSLRDPWGIEGS